MAQGFYELKVAKDGQFMFNLKADVYKRQGFIRWFLITLCSEILNPNRNLCNASFLSFIGVFNPWNSCGNGWWIRRRRVVFINRICLLYTSCSNCKYGIPIRCCSCSKRRCELSASICWPSDAYLVLNVVDNPLNAIFKANFIGVLAWSIGLGLALRHASDATKQVVADFRCV